MNKDDVKRRDRDIFAAQTKPDPFHGSMTAHEMRDSLLAWTAKWMTSHPEFHRGLKCLDIGCGGGFNSEWLGKHSGFVIGLDHTNRRVSEARERLPDLEKFGFMVADGESPPVKTRSLDVVLCVAILHHLPNYRSALSSYRQCLKESGMIILSEPCAYNPFAVIRRRFFPSETHTPDERPFSPKKLIGELRKVYDTVVYKRFHLFSVNAPLVERMFGLRIARLYLRIFSRVDDVLLKIPVIKEACWLICLIGFNKSETYNRH